MRVLLALSLLLPFPLAAAGPSELSEERQGELIHLLRHDCGSCHGMTLKGGLGPALTEEALAGKTLDYLYLTVREGHPGTPMPPWRGILDDLEIRWLVTRLQNGELEP